VDLYLKKRNPKVLQQAEQWLVEQFDRQSLDHVLESYVHDFPPQAVYLGQLSPASYLEGETAGLSNRELILKEMLLGWLDNMNSAASPFTELFDDAGLEKDTPYLQIIHLLRQFFETQPGFGTQDQNLVDMLRSPAVQVPTSLSGQLEYIREKWGILLEGYLDRLIQSLDLLKEEEKLSFAGPGEAQVIQFEGLGLEGEPERYSTDREWMPHLVMIAKSTYV
jgi:hypothetical protein